MSSDSFPMVKASWCVHISIKRACHIRTRCINMQQHDGAWKNTISMASQGDEAGSKHNGAWKNTMNVASQSGHAHKKKAINKA